MKKLVSTVLLVSTSIIYSSISAAKEIPSADAERHGFSSERLIKITEFMNDQVDNGAMVGGLGLIAREGKIIYQKTFGLADREQAKKMSKDSIFRIYSMTKPITSVALMTLYEDGLFKLNDPISKYLPEFLDVELALSPQNPDDKSLLGKTKPPSRPPTILDLLRHTAGFTYGVFGNSEVDQLYRKAGLLGDNLDLKGFSEALAAIPLQYEPGSRYHYSVSVDIQGRLIEVLSGKRFSMFLKERLFEPLDMRDTDFQVTDENSDRLVQIYSPSGATGLSARNLGGTLVPVSDESMKRFLEEGKFESGGGGLVSTVRDYLRFAQMLLNGGELFGERVLSPKTIQLMAQNHLATLPKYNDSSGWGFGLGFGLSLSPSKQGVIGSAGTFGWSGVAGTRFWIDPAEEMIGIFFVQTIPNNYALADKFRTLMYAAVEESKQPLH